tara:strand:+ start:629 stop:1237 length:609 start_codon:yes stop_codon:yes gene_type:complete
LLDNKSIRAEARNRLSGNWGQPIGVFSIYLLITIVLQNIPFIGPIALIFVAGPLTLGFTIYFLKFLKDEESNLNQLFEGFKNYGSVLVTYLLYTIYILLWTLLFIIPGIIAQMKYSQVWFIMAEDHEISGNDALKKSKEMMDGFKMQYFLLALSFIGWILLAMLTCGIGLLWVVPYIQTSYAKFYEALKEHHAQNHNLIEEN